MKIFVIIVIIIGITISLFFPAKWLDKKIKSRFVKLAIVYLLFGTLISFVACYIPYLNEDNPVNTAIIPRYVQFLILSPFMAIIFYCIDGLKDIRRKK